MIFITHVFNLNSDLCIIETLYLYSHPSTHCISGMAVGSD